MRRGLRVAIAASLVLAVVLLPAPPAVAHAVLLGANPSPNIGLGAPPNAVRLRLSEPLRVPPSAIRVLDRDGRDFVVSVRRLASDPQSMEASLRPMERGVYKVEWKSVSVLDGHTIRGSYFFGIGRAPPGAPAQTQTGLLSGAGAPGIVARVVQDAALLLLLGLAALLLLARGSAFGTARLLPAAGLAAFAGALATAAADGIAAAGWSLTGVGRFLTGSVAGWGRFLTVAASLGALGAAAARRAGAVAALASAALVGVAISGHAGATTHPLPSMAANAAHLLLVGIWLGGAAAIALVWRHARPAREEIVSLIARVSPFAIASALLVAATGSVNALGQLTAPSDLWTTGYGAVVLVKAAALLVAAGLGFRHSFVLRPRLVASPPGRGAPARGIRRAVSGEAWTGFVAVLLATLLVAIPDPPAQEARAEAQRSTVPAIFAIGRRPFVTVAERDGNHVIGLVVAPPRPGEVTLAVQFVAGSDVDLERLRLEISAAGPGVTPVRKRMRPCGPGCFLADARLDAAGVWSFAVRADDPEETTVSFRIPLPARDGSEVYERLRRAWDALRSLQIDERFRGPNEFVIDTRYRYEAPDRGASETSRGREEVDIGERSFTRDSPDASWMVSRNPFPTRVPYPLPWQRATEEPRLLEDLVVDGRPAYGLAVFDPFGIWYRIVVDMQTFRPLVDRMRAVGHFMDRRYSRFDQPLAIQAPRI